MAEQKDSAKEVEIMGLKDLVYELKRQKLNSFDIIAVDHDIYAIADEDLGLMLGVYDRKDGL